jgi:hypothetical protein
MHRIMFDGVTPVIAETRLSWPADRKPPSGGVDSALLRRINVGGVREAVLNKLAAQGISRLQLRALEAVNSETRRHGEALRWSLAVTCLAYVAAIREGSRHPNEDAARALGIGTRTVRDRLFVARRQDPPYVTGGGGRGIVGQPELTDAAYLVILDRVRRSLAALGMPPDTKLRPFWRNDVGSFARVASALLYAAERRLPGYWELTMEEVIERGHLGGAWELPPGTRFDLTPQGLDVVNEHSTR